MAIPPDGYLGNPARTTAEYQVGIDDLTAALNDPTTGLDAKQGSAALGTAAFVNTGTGAADVPLNSQLGTAAALDTGTGAGQLPTTAQADARYLVETNNLSDLTNDTTARSNLDVYSTSQVDSKIQNANWVLKWSGSSSTPRVTWGNGTYLVRTTFGAQKWYFTVEVTQWGVLGTTHIDGGECFANSSTIYNVYFSTNTSDVNLAFFKCRYIEGSGATGTIAMDQIWRNEP